MYSLLKLCGVLTMQRANVGKKFSQCHNIPYAAEHIACLPSPRYQIARTLIIFVLVVDYCLTLLISYL